MTNPKPLFPFADYQAAKDALHRAIETRQPWILFTGESGCGKTSLIREMRGELDRCRIRIFYFNLARLSPAGLVRVLARSLRMPPLRSQPETVKAIAKLLLDEPYHSLLVIDEGQMLPEETFDELRTLSEVDLDGRTPLSVLLAGLPDLRERLRAPHFFPMWRRLLCRLEITGLTRDEMRPLAQHLLGPELSERVVDEALDVLFEHGRGLPGLLGPYLERTPRYAPNGPFLADHAEQLVQDFNFA
jgi:type II secretory pathway predicted ATPase ExeA